MNMPKRDSRHHCRRSDGRTEGRSDGRTEGRKVDGRSAEPAVARSVRTPSAMAPASAALRCPKAQLAVGNGGWKRAESVAAYRQAVAALARNPGVLPTRGEEPAPGPPPS